MLHWCSRAKQFDAYELYDILLVNEETRFVISWVVCEKRAATNTVYANPVATKFQITEQNLWLPFYVDMNTKV